MDPERQRTNKASLSHCWSVVSQPRLELQGKESFYIDERMVLGFILNWSLEYLKLIILISIFILFEKRLERL